MFFTWIVRDLDIDRDVFSIGIVPQEDVMVWFFSICRDADPSHEYVIIKRYL